MIPNEAFEIVAFQQFGTGDFLYFGIIFIILAIIAGVLGARGIAGVTMGIARIFIVIFIVLAVISFIL